MKFDRINSNDILPADHIECVEDLNYEQCSQKVKNSTQIQQFYENQSIFITGGTGFLGKILIEKLLRSCPDINKIFILIREKKEKNVDERKKKLLEDSVFVKSRQCVKNFEEKIHAIVGDCSLKNFGISENDAMLLKQKVSIVFHVAATVRFNEKLKRATAINTLSTSTVVDMCKEMKNLKSFVHVSTAWSNCFAADIEEKFYDYSINHKQLLALVDVLPDNMIDEITPEITKLWPNTYTFTKALAEDLVRVECKNLPAGIFRPGVVTPSAYEPIPGWIDNYNGPSGITAGVASGILRTYHCDPKGSAYFVPVDLTVNALIASAWDVTQQTNRKADEMLIYNYTSLNDDAPMTWGTVAKNIVKSVNDYPLLSALWCAEFRLTNYTFIYHFYTLFLHLIPACLFDLGMLIVGQKPRLYKTYEKIHQNISAYNYFTTCNWQIRNDNVRSMWKRLDKRDQQIFQFIVLDFNWDEYFDIFIKGIRIFLFRDELKTLEMSRKKYQRFLLIHGLIVSLLAGIACWILWRLLSIIYYLSFYSF